MPYLDGLTVVVGHPPRPGTAPHDIPSIYSEIQFTEFLSKACHDQSSRSTIHRIIKVDEGHRVKIAVEVGRTFDWGTSEVNALRLSITHDDEDLSKDVDIFIDRPGRIAAIANPEGVEPFENFRCSFDQFPLPVKDAPDLDQTVSFVIRGLPVSEDAPVPKDESPTVIRQATFGTIRIRVDRVTIIKETEARKRRQRTSNVPFADDIGRTRKVVQTAEQLLRKGITSKINHEHGTVRSLQWPIYKDVQDGMVGRFVFHYRLPDRYDQLLSKPCRILPAGNNGTQAVPAEDDEVIPPIEWGNRSVASRFASKRTRLDVIPDNLEQEDGNHDAISDSNVDAATSTPADCGMVDFPFMAAFKRQGCGHQSSAPAVLNAKPTRQVLSSIAANGQRINGPKESAARQRVNETEAVSDAGVGPPADDEGLSAEDDDVSDDDDDSVEGQPPPPSRVLRGQPGELLDGDDHEIESLEEQSRLLDYMLEDQAAKERLHAESIERNKAIMANIAEQRALRHIERVEVEKAMEDAAKESEEEETQLIVMKEELAATQEALSSRRVEIQAEMAAMDQQLNEYDDATKNMDDEQDRRSIVHHKMMDKKRKREALWDEIRAKQARLQL